MPKENLENTDWLYAWSLL